MSVTVLKEALLKAADWIETDREHHIGGRLSLDEHGNTSLDWKDGGPYFCAIGRIGHELAQKMPVTDPYKTLHCLLESSGLEPHEALRIRASIVEHNDDSSDTMEVGWRSQCLRGDPTVANRLRQLADTLE